MLPIFPLGIQVASTSSVVSRSFRLSTNVSQALAPSREPLFLRASGCRTSPSYPAHRANSFLHVAIWGPLVAFQLRVISRLLAPRPGPEICLSFYIWPHGRTNVSDSVPGSLLFLFGSILSKPVSLLPNIARYLGRSTSCA